MSDKELLVKIDKLLNSPNEGDITIGIILTYKLSATFFTKTFWLYGCDTHGYRFRFKRDNRWYLYCYGRIHFVDDLFSSFLDFKIIGNE